MCNAAETSIACPPGFLSAVKPAWGILFKQDRWDCNLLELRFAVTNPIIIALQRHSFFLLLF